MRALVLLVVFACGSPQRVLESPPNPELSPALEPLAWWLGDWKSDMGTEHWIAANGAIYGISLAGDNFEVMVVDDGEGTAPADGILRFIASPGGTKAVEFKAAEVSGQRASFANPEHDDPKSITYAREGDGLKATLEGTQQLVFSFKPASRTPAPELEAADRAFSADVGKRGIEGWMAAFAPNGGMIQKGARIEGDKIRAMMGPLLATGVLAWDPIASGVDRAQHGKAGTLGFTVGKATFTATSGAPADNWASTYTTIWKQQPDGTWKVLFDLGRPVNQPR